jgi:hypothetical protein
VNAERDAVRAADRQRHSVRRALIRRLKDLPDGALLELLAAWLNAVGVHSLRAVRANGDFNLAGTLRRGPEETPIAISIYKGPQPVDKEAIVALRGLLHDFDHARMGWVITLGKAADGTTAEGHAEGAAPCAVFDGDALAASMEEVGIGLQRVSLPMAVLDVDLLDSLGGGATRNKSQASTSEETGDANTNKRRRSRRRGGRRRGAREEGSEDGGSEEMSEASQDAADSERPAGESPEPQVASESTAEPSEDTEKKTADKAPEPPVEVGQL